MRTEFPFMGKRQLRVILAREGLELSQSAIGRILGKGVRLGRIRPCAFCGGRVNTKRRMQLNDQTQRFLAVVPADHPHPLISFQVRRSSFNKPRTASLSPTSPEPAH